MQIRFADHRKLTAALVLLLQSPFVTAQTANPYPPVPQQNIWLAQYEQPAPVQPRTRESQQQSQQNGNYKMTMPEDLFGHVNQVDRLSEHRRKLAQSPAADAVFGAEAKGRVSNDVGDLLRKSISSHGISTQDRTPIVSDHQH